MRLKTKKSSVDMLVEFFHFSFVALIILCLPAWVTHIIWIIGALASDQGATIGQMVLGGIGAFMPPVGVVHGWMIWFGYGA